jgi:hypothetical protein
VEQSATGGAGSYGWSSQLRVEQSATSGAVSYGWSSQLRVEQSATGGAVSYGWSSQLRVEQSATGGAVSYGWSSQLRVEQSATGGAVSYGWNNDDDSNGQISDASFKTPRFLLSIRSEGEKTGISYTNLLLVGLVGETETLIIRLPRANYRLPPFYPFRHSNSHLHGTLIRAVQLTPQN